MGETSGRITLWGIEVFLATAEEGAISAAARRLGASPSAVSQQLSNLEAALGAELLNRRERPVTLTTAGEALRRRAQVIVNEADRARAELAAIDARGLSHLRLGMIEDFDGTVTPSLLADMAQEWTGTQFTLETGPSHRLFDQLGGRGLDVIVAADMGAAAGWMEVHPLLVEPFVAAVPRGRVDPGTSAEPMLGALSSVPLIEYTTRHYMGRQIADHLTRQNLTLAHRFELDSYHAIMALVAGGAGWTILSALGVLHAQRFAERVDILPLPFAPLERRISLSARREALGDLPGDVAARLRPLIAEQIVAPALERHPWLEGQMRVL